MNAQELSQEARTLALAIWQEQLDYGIGEPDEAAAGARLDEWLDNRTYPGGVLERAASGDVAALIQVRTEADLPVFS